MNQSNLTTLLLTQSALGEEQYDLSAEIKANSKNPEKTEELLRMVIDSAIKYTELSYAIIADIHEVRTPFWKKLFRK